MNKITIRQLAASTLLWLAACIVVGLAASAAYAQGAPNKLESIDVQNMSGQQLQLTLQYRKRQRSGETFRELSKKGRRHLQVSRPQIKVKASQIP